MGLFSKKKTTKSAKGKNSIVDEFAAYEIKEKDNVLSIMDKVTTINYEYVKYEESQTQN